MDRGAYVLRRVIKGVGANALGQLVLLVVQLVQVPILSSHWGLGRYGLWLMLSTIPSYLGFSDLGFGKAATNDMVMRVAVGDRDGALRTYQSATVLVYVLAAIMLAVFQLAVFLVPDSLFGTAAPAAESRVALAFMICYGISSLAGPATSSGPLQSTGNYAAEATAGAMMWACEGLGTVTMVLLGGSMVQVAAMLLGVRLCFIALMTVLARRRAPWLVTGTRHASGAEIRRLFGPATGMMVIPLANALVLQGTAMAVGLSATPAAVPAFTATRTLSRVPMQLSGILVRAIMPEFGAAAGRGDRALQVRLLALSMASSLVLLVPVALILAVAGPRIVLLWTHGAVHTSYLLMGVMCLVLLANGLWVPLSNLVIAVNRQSLFTWRFLALSIAAVPVTYLLAPSLGPVSGALGMLMVDGIMLTMLLSIISRLVASPSEILEAIPAAWQSGQTLVLRRLRER